VIARGRLVACTLAAVAGALALAGGAGAGSSSAPVSVRVDKTEIASGLGDAFQFKTTITNTSGAATEPLVAHLNILTLRPGVYVDPEDWSTQRTWFLEPIPPRRAVTITWSLKAVGSGTLAAYVAVLPQDRPTAPPTMSPTVRVAVEERRLINAGGILPLALGVPAFLGLLAGGVRFARRRH
jgi:hypothetical protein